jgi:hypothetical protein
MLISTLSSRPLPVTETTPPAAYSALSFQSAYRQVEQSHQTNIAKTGYKNTAQLDVNAQKPAVIAESLLLSRGAGPRPMTQVKRLSQRIIKTQGSAILRKLHKLCIARVKIPIRPAFQRKPEILKRIFMPGQAQINR